MVQRVHEITRKQRIVTANKAQFIKLYGPRGPKMTWEQRAKAGVDAKHFQAALAAKGGS